MGRGDILVECGRFGTKFKIYISNSINPCFSYLCRMSEPTIKKLPVIVYAESTPNPAAMKFVVNKILNESGTPVEFGSAADAKNSPLAQALFNFPFVKGVFIAGNYVTVIKDEKLDWNDITLELREFIKEFFASGKQAFSSKENGHTAASNGHSKPVEHVSSVMHMEPQTETEKKIVDVLEQYVIPAVQQDGGMIVFRSFKDGVVSLMMRGACSGCPSSTVTLKSGIETMLKRFVPEVQEVVSIAD